MAVFKEEVDACKTELGAADLSQTDVIEALITAWVDDRNRKKSDKPATSA